MFFNTRSGEGGVWLIIISWYQSDTTKRSSCQAINVADTIFK
jgi:hypothetical protein